jgi:hypothetical protein
MHRQSIHVAVTWVVIIMSSSSGDAFATLPSSNNNNNNNNSNNNHRRNRANNGHASAAAADANSGSGDNAKSEIPQLPMGDPNKDIPSVRLGETIRFKEFGPIILNSDGEWNSRLLRLAMGV